MGEAAVILKNEDRLVGKRSQHCVPINCVRRINIEVGDDRPPLQRHVRWRRKIFLLDVLHIADQGLLRCAAGAGIPFDSALVHHDREREAGMLFRLRHHQLRGLVDAVVRTIPVDHHAIDPAADHICDLVVNLGRARRAISHIHVVRAAEP